MPNFYTPMLGVELKTVSDDGIMKVYELHENDMVTGLKYMCDGEEVSIDGIIDAIPVVRKNVYSTTGQIIDGRSTSPDSQPGTCPTSLTAPYTLGLTGMVIDVATAMKSKHVYVRFDDIIEIGEIAATETKVTPEDLPAGGLTEVLTSAEVGATVSLSEGVYENTSALTIDKSITLVGPNDVPQKPIATNSSAAVAALAEGDGAATTIDMPGAVITGDITVNAPGAEVVFRGLSFTGKTFPVIAAADKVSFINCRFDKLAPTDAKTYLIKTTSTDPMKLTIQGCYFGPVDPTATGKLYNLFELNAPLVSGSSFVNNYFDLDHCAHNSINVYACVNNATITISDNHSVKSAAMVRLGIKEDRTCKIVCDGNSYDTTDVPEWAGLMTIQPYGKVTTSMANWTVLINNTVAKEYPDQLAVIYFGKNDLTYSKEVLPKVYVNNVETECPIVNDQTA